MGCWNKTCGLTGLPIYAGDKVYVVVLQEGYTNERCGTTALWQPVVLPFISHYNDYGGGYDSHENIQYVLNGIKERMIEMPQGENSVHDIPVTKDGFNEGMFFSAVLENRLTVSQLGEVSGVDFVMLRKDVVDDLCSRHRIVEYVGEGLGTSGRNNSYTEYGFNDIVSEVPEFVDRLFELPKKAVIMAIRYGDDSLSDRVINWLSRTRTHHFSGLVHPDLEIWELYEQRDKQKAVSFIIDVIRLLCIDKFMSRTRKIWVPGCHEGSQDGVTDAYSTLCDIITNGMVAIKQRFDEDS